jgi:hypothetical protein
MSKFKSYAEQGSFRSNALEIPDKAKKIQAEGERRIRGMNKSQAALETNQQLFLASQQQAQNVEMQTREMNEKFEREHRQRYIKALEKDTEIDRARRDAQTKRQQDILGALAEFSVSAAKQFIDISGQNEQNKVKEINARISAAGLEHTDLLSYINIDKTFTEQQALQTDVAINLLKKYGDTPEIRSLLTEARNDASYKYTQSKAAVSNQINRTYPALLDAAIANMEPGASYDQQMALISTTQADFRSKLGIEPRILEGFGGDRIRAITNQYIASFHTESQRRAKAEREEGIFNLYTSLAGSTMDNMQSIVDYMSDKPSREKRDSILKWAELNFRSGNLSYDSYNSLIKEVTYKDQNGEKTTIRDQFGGIPGVAEAVERLNSERGRQLQIMRQEQAQYKAEVNSELIDYFNSTAIVDGNFQTAEKETLEQMAQARGVNLEELPIFDRLKGLTDDERSQEAALEMLANDFANLNMSREKILSMQLPYQIQMQAFNMLNQQEKITEPPGYDENLKRVRQFPLNLGDGAALDAIKVAYRDGRNRDNVDQYTDQLELEYKQLVAQGDSPASAAAAVAKRHVATNGGLDKINELGQYKSIIEENKIFLKGHYSTYDQYKTFRDGMSNFYSNKNPEIVTKSLSPKMLADFNQAYDQPGSNIPSFVRAYAAEKNKDPLQVMNDMGIALGKDEYDVVDPTYLNIKRNLPPQNIRLLNTYRDVVQRTGRGTNTPFPTRSAFAQLDRSKSVFYSQGQLMGIAIEGGFTEEQAYILSAIAMAESKGEIAIDTVKSGTDPNKKKEYSVGAFQINLLAHQDKLDRHGFTEDDMRDPRKAIIIVKEIYDEAVLDGKDGFDPWSVYTNGRYKNFTKNSIQF